MKKRVLWLGLSFLLVTALVLASCGEAVPGEQEEEEEEEEEEEPAADVPQYGGTLNVLSLYTSLVPPDLDPLSTTYIVSMYTPPHMETLLTGDVLKYGPRGTDEYGFTLTETVPHEFLRGQLAESWEITRDPLGVRFNIREGVMWQANAYLNFEPRELTAYDVAAALNRFSRTPALRAAWIYFMPIDPFEALDRYTLQAHFDTFNADWPDGFAYAFFSSIYPPETIEAGAGDYRNHIGTGPFIVTEHVTGSYVSWKRNPDWWASKKIINGKEYDTPFIDEMVYPMIMDEATQISAVRTGKIDWAHYIKRVYKESLETTSPDLIMSKYLSGNLLLVRWAAGPDRLMDDRNLRRAIQQGTDVESILKTIYGEGIAHALPYNPLLPKYTPVEELPPGTKELFTYNPDKARQMIIDAGYPNGFDLTLNYYATSWESPDIAPLLKDMWDKIGINVTLAPVEDVLMRSMWAAGEVEYGYIVSTGNAKIGGLRMYVTNPWDVFYNDDWFKEQMGKASTSLDPADYTRIEKELAVYANTEAGVLSLGNPYTYLAWWPWVKNYYGELEQGYNNYMDVQSTLWIDQDLKEKMGY